MKKFKHWLIKKLGGYDDTSNIYRVEHCTTPLVQIDAIISLPWNESLDSDAIEWCLARELAKEIKREELYEIEEEISPFSKEKGYRVSIRVAPRERGGEK